MVVKEKSRGRGVSSKSTDSEATDKKDRGRDKKNKYDSSSSSGSSSRSSSSSSCASSSTSRSNSSSSSSGSSSDSEPKAIQKKLRESKDNRRHIPGKKKDKKSPSPKKKKNKKPTTKPVRIHIRGLTRNVTKAHLNEIFSTFGAIKFINYCPNRLRFPIGLGFAYVEYTRPEMANNAMKLMNGGQIDGQEITCAPAEVVRRINRRSPPTPPHRRSGRSPLRFRRRSPMRRPPQRRRSPLPPPRRRHSPPRRWARYTRSSPRSSR